MVEGQVEEGAAAKAAPVGGQTELDLLNGGDAASLFVGGMVCPHIGQGVNVVHLLGGQRLLGWVLDHPAPLFFIRLHQALGNEGVGIAVLLVKTLGVGSAVGAQSLIGRQRQGVVDALQAPGLVDGAPDIGDIGDVQAAVQGLRHLHDASLAHAVKQ